MDLRTALGLALLPLIGLAAWRPAGAAARPPAPPATRQVTVRGVSFAAEVAVTAGERARGLMYRESLPEDRAMLFVFPEPGMHGFWMKNTLIPLDIVFIGEDRRVVSVARDAQPCREEPCNLYTPARPAAYALEIAGGQAERHGITAGDLVEFR